MITFFLLLVLALILVDSFIRLSPVEKFGIYSPSKLRHFIWAVNHNQETNSQFYTAIFLNFLSLLSILIDLGIPDISISISIMSYAWYLYNLGIWTEAYITRKGDPTK